MIATRTVWQCKQCHFQGRLFGSAKPYTIDPNVHTDEDTGIRYKWVFLAKSHTKVKLGAKLGEGGYGCMFCSLANCQTGVWGSSDLLFRHIADEHVPVLGGDPGLVVRARCVLGRKATVHEDWDINIV